MGCDDKDLIHPIGPLPDGRTLVSRHRPDHSTQIATIRSAPAGTSMVAGEEFIVTRHRPDGQLEVTDSYVHGTRPRSGPAQVATAGYRDGWDRTFSAPGGSA